MTKPEWNFDNSYTLLPEGLYTRITPEEVPNPEVVIINFPLGKALGLHLENLKDKDLALLFSGNVLPKGASPIAQAYAGHQFGYFTNLGDGRAHLIGELLTPDGRRVDLQLKGSGKTPYGLRGDGKATLGPMLREYLISEAMHALEIPTTRSLAVVLTGEQVYRETALPGAILTRVASSHLRIGTFEFAAAKNDLTMLKSLADYTLSRHYPEALETNNPYLSLLETVIERQTDLIIHWMRVGFIHGVMNTDNMSISGETIDYGPCAFMDFYDPATVYSAIDRDGRYAFANQPAIAQWNLTVFAETLLPLLDKDPDTALEIAQQSVASIPDLYAAKWLQMMRRKLGLTGEHASDKQLIMDLHHCMQQQKLDYTNTFRSLSLNQKPVDNQAFDSWYQRWQSRRKQQSVSPDEGMKTANPAVIPRNHHVNQALEAALNKDFKPFEALLKALENPYADRKAFSRFQLPPEPGEQIVHTFCGT